MCQQGEIYWVDTLAGRRPAIVLSRDELNRGNWVVVVLITSSQYENRSTLPNCVPFQAGDYGLTRDCVAQAESVTFIAVADMDTGAGPVGKLDVDRFRDLVRAVGNMMGSECEPI